MLPIIFSVAHRFGGSVLTYALPAAGAFAVMHAFVPPHPGPVAAGDLLGADIGLLVFVGLVVAIPTWYLGSYLFGLWVGKRFVLPVPELLGSLDAPTTTRTPPPFGTVMLVLLLPLVLIFLNTGLNTLATAGAVDGEATWVNLLRMIGQTPVALLITVLVAMWKLERRPLGVDDGEDHGRGARPGLRHHPRHRRRRHVRRRAPGQRHRPGARRQPRVARHAADRRRLPDLDRAPGRAGLGDGGADHHRRAAGADGGGDDRAQRASTSASWSSPSPAARPCCRHVNDSGFWLVGRFLQMDEKTTLKTWTVMETLLGTHRLRLRAGRLVAAVTAAPQHIVVMGVSGSGKTTVGEALAAALGWRFVEGDSFHPPANVAKMSAGHPLDDADRRPWLEALAAEIARDDAAGRSSVVGCSSLKRGYRDILRTGAPRVRFLHVHGDRTVLAERVSNRPGHFFPATLLDSQLATLEPLGADEDGVVVDVALPVEAQVEAARRGLDLY